MKKTIENTTVCKDVEKLKPMWMQPLQKNGIVFPKKLNTESQHDPGILLLGIYTIKDQILPPHDMPI